MIGNDAQPIKGVWNGCKEKQQAEKNKLKDCCMFGVFIWMTFMYCRSEHRTLTCTGCIHCLPVTVDGIIACYQ